MLVPDIGEISFSEDSTSSASFSAPIAISDCLAVLGIFDKAAFAAALFAAYLVR